MRLLKLYENWARSSNYMTVAKKMLLNNATENLKVLDIGPGKGELLHALRSKFGMNIGLSAIDRHESVLKSLPENTTLIRANLWQLLDYENGIKELPVPDESFDMIILTEVIEHVIFPQILISEIARMLKPSGVLLISTPNIHMIGNRLAMLFGVDKIFHRTGSEGFISKLNYHPYGHVGHYSIASLKELLGPWFEVKTARSAAFNIPLLRYAQPLFARIFPTLATSMIMLEQKRPLKRIKLDVINCPLTLSAQLVLPDDRCLHPQIHSQVCRDCKFFHTDFTHKSRIKKFRTKI